MNREIKFRVFFDGKMRRVHAIDWFGGDATTITVWQLGELLWEVASESEVIGNIYENPELMEGN